MTINVGDSASVTRIITSEMVQSFAEIAGDKNPLHLDDEFAAESRFGQRIAHGMLVSGLISSVLGNQLPGMGTVYLSQSLRFQAPVFIDDTITATATVTDIRADKPIITLNTECHNQDGEIVIAGEAVVLYETPSTHP